MIEVAEEMIQAPDLLIEKRKSIPEKMAIEKEEVEVDVILVQNLLPNKKNLLKNLIKKIKKNPKRVLRILKKKGKGREKEIVNVNVKEKGKGTEKLKEKEREIEKEEKEKRKELIKRKLKQKVFFE